MKKTAITLSIEREEKILNDLISQHQIEFPGYARLSLEIQIREQKKRISFLKNKLLTTEREQIEGAHKSGQERCTSKTSNHLAGKYYNNTYGNGD